jgi:hypothetical protein
MSVVTMADRRSVAGSRPMARHAASSARNFSAASAGSEDVRLNSSPNFAALR